MQWIGGNHFLRVARGVILKGAHIGSLLTEVLATLVILTVALGLAIATFRKWLR